MYFFSRLFFSTLLFSGLLLSALLLVACQKSPEDVVDGFMQAANANNHQKALSFFDRSSRQLLEEVALYKSQKNEGKVSNFDPLSDLFSDYQARSIEEIIVLEQKADRAVVEVRRLSDRSQKFVLKLEEKQWKIHFELDKKD